jgi:RNA polymerase sigma-70 factor (ECF subfamily)
VEDVVQRAFIKAFTKLESFNENARFSTWLFAIAINELRTDQRSRSLVFIDPTELYEIKEEPAIDFEWHDTMKTLLKDIEPIKRAVFLLYEVEGYSHNEIGSILGITENLSRTLLCRTKNILRIKWKSFKDAI